MKSKKIHSKRTCGLCGEPIYKHSYDETRFSDAYLGYYRCDTPAFMNNYPSKSIVNKPETNPLLEWVST